MRSNMRRGVCCLGLVGMVGALLASLPNAANADQKRYPATMCRQWAGPQGFLFFSSFVAPGLPARSTPQQNGGTCPPPEAGGCPSCQSIPACANDPQNSVSIDCPIPKTFPDAGVQNVTVDVINRHDVLNTVCFLTSALWNPATDTFNTTFQTLHTAGSGNNIQPLRFSPMTAPGAAAHWYISCTLPANSALVSYFVNEN